MVIQGIKLIGKQSATTEFIQRDHSADTKLHYTCTRISAFRSLTCGDYQSDLLLIWAAWAPSTSDNFIYMWHHLQATTPLHFLDSIKQKISWQVFRAYNSGSRSMSHDPNKGCEGSKNGSRWGI